MPRTTEQPHPLSRELEQRDDVEILSLLQDGHRAAIDSLSGALPDLERGAALMTTCIAEGGSLAYAGAGSSALMAMADALELPGTFGISPDRVRIHMAGGLPGAQQGMPGHTEDDAATATRDAQGLGPGDCALIIAASGQTPYALAFRDAARAAGARVVAISNTPGAPLLEHCDVGICLPTPAEVIAGSTRLGAGTAQKAALNLMSTLMGIRLGHVHDGYMVNLVADNIKLRERAARIVAAIAGCDAATAARHLAATEGQVKPAILMALGAPTAQIAAERLARAGGVLRNAIPARHEARAG